MVIKYNIGRTIYLEKHHKAHIYFDGDTEKVDARNYISGNVLNWLKR